MNEEIVKDFYLLALTDIINGASIAQLNRELKMYEKEELYEECVGIRNAINDAKTKSIQELKLIIIENEIRNNKKNS